MIQCIHCGKLFKPLGIAAHIRIKHTENGADFISLGNKARRGAPPWNKGLTADIDERIQQSALKMSQSRTGMTFTMSEETKSKISKTMKLNGCGGYRPGSGLGKRDGIKVFSVIVVGN